METTIIASRSWRNASAFIEVNENNEISVYGKFYDDGRGFPGPEVRNLGILPAHLAEELKLAPNKRSDEFRAFCQDIWQKAKGKTIGLAINNDTTD